MEGEAVSSGETWVIDRSPTITSEILQNINFTVNSELGTHTCTQIYIIPNPAEPEPMPVGPGILGWDISQGTYVQFYDGSSWLTEIARWFEFETSPTGNLLDWLNNNAAKQ